MCLMGMTMVARAQFAPMSAPCADPCPPGLDVRPACPPNDPFPPPPHSCVWYPERPSPEDWADRRPSAEIRLSNGNWVDNDRGLLDLWWDATFDGQPWTCFDTQKDDFSGFDVGSNWFSGTGGNGRPDQFDWLIAQLDDRWNRGYRRIVLYAPAGVVACQFVPQSQWWPMAPWRRAWFEETGVPNDPHSTGVAGWMAAHPDVEMGVYIGWIVAHPCTICLGNTNSTNDCVSQTITCNGAQVSVKLRPCVATPAALPPRTTSAVDMCMVSQNVQPWRDMGFKRVWLDFAASDASGGSVEFRNFVYNPTYRDEEPMVVFGGEALPAVNSDLLPPLRFAIDWEELAWSPFVISLADAENDRWNGAPCAGGGEPNAHSWDIITAPPPYLNPPLAKIREAAIWPVALPTCYPGGPVKPEWDEPWERLKNLYELYICRGFTFWQGDLDGAQSGAAERFFGFGKIQPAGDFDGDGSFQTGANNLDWQRWQSQFWTWYFGQGSLGADKRLTYYHGDMDGNGILTAYVPGINNDDLDLAERYIRDHELGNGVYPLPNGPLVPPAVPGPMNWDPNVQWLPCPPSGSSSSSSGP
ncbi:MAG: hypothetical protein ACKVU4_07285 [Phycisphaerales bacterium]